MRRQLRTVFQRGLYLCIACAVDRAIGGEPAQRSSEAAKRSEINRVALDRAPSRIGETLRDRDQDAAEQSASKTADHAADRDRKPVEAVVKAHRAGAEIGI